MTEQKCKSLNHRNATQTRKLMNKIDGLRCSASISSFCGTNDNIPQRHTHRNYTVYMSDIALKHTYAHGYRPSAPHTSTYTCNWPPREASFDVQVCVGHKPNPPSGAMKRQPRYVSPDRAKTPKIASKIRNRNATVWQRSCPDAVPNGEAVMSRLQPGIRNDYGNQVSNQAE
jgi:hypothetical protein